MDLAALFIKSIQCCQDAEYVLQALNCVNKEFSTVLRPNTREELCIQFFFECEGDVLNPKKEYYDLIELWKAAEPYIWNWKQSDIMGFWVMHMISETELVWQINQYNQIIDRESGRHLKVLKELSESIEDISNKKYMVDFLLDCSYCGIQGIYSLNRFDEQCYHPYRDFLMRKLYYLLCNGGEVVVVAGEKGLTPRRIFCFKMKDFLWEKKGVRSKKLRQQVLEENLEIRRKSVIPGFLLDDLW